MDWTCIPRLTSDKVSEVIRSVPHVVHRLVPDEFRINDTNQEGRYNHPIFVEQQDMFCYVDHQS